MESESQYMSRRAQEEQEAADRAVNPKARDLHIELAGRYRDAAHGQKPPSTPDAGARRGLPNDFRILE